MRFIFLENFLKSFLNILKIALRIIIKQTTQAKHGLQCVVFCYKKYLTMIFIML